MKDFHYDCIKKKHGHKAGVSLIDTDSITYKIRAENFMNTSTKIKSYLTSVITQKMQNIIMIQIT